MKDDLVEQEMIAVEIRFLWQGEWHHELHKWPLTHKEVATKICWEIGREILPTIRFSMQGENPEAVREALNYLDNYTPPSVYHGGAFYDKRNNQIIASYAGEWLPDDQLTVSSNINKMFGIEIDFQEF